MALIDKYDAIKKAATVKKKMILLCNEFVDSGYVNDLAPLVNDEDAIRAIDPDWSDEEVTVMIALLNELVPAYQKMTLVKNSTQSAFDTLAE